MRAGRLTVRALLLAAVLLPAAAAEACRESVMVSVGTESSTVRVDTVYGGDLAKLIRREADAGAGNDDGTLEPAELAAYLGKWAHDTNDDNAHCLREAYLVIISGKGPDAVRRVHATSPDAQATSVDSIFPLRVSWTVDLVYDASEAARAEVVVQLTKLALFREAVNCAHPPMQDWDWGSHVCGVDTRDPVRSERYLAVVPARAHEIDMATVEPQTLREAEWQGGLWAESALHRDTMAKQVVFFYVEKQGPSALAVGLGAGAGAVAAVGLVFALPPSRRWVAGAMMGIPGFSRLSRGQALENPLREELVERVRTQPGLSLSDLQRQTDVPKGTLTHHLRMLERHGHVRSQREGSRTRFFPRGPRVERPPYLSRVQKQILQAIDNSPGLTQQALSLQLGVTRDVVAYNTRRLAELGRLRIEKDGARRRYVLPATKA